MGFGTGVFILILGWITVGLSIYGTFSSFMGLDQNIISYIGLALAAIGIVMVIRSRFRSIPR